MSDTTAQNGLEVAAEAPKAAAVETSKAAAVETSKPEAVDAAKTEASNGDSSAPRRGGRRNRQKSDRQQQMDESNIEAEFASFVQRLRRLNVNNDVVYQINNYKEGLECSFRVGREPGQSGFTTNFRNSGTQGAARPRKELTPAQLAKVEARREHNRARNAERRAARMEERKKLREEREAAGEGEAAPTAAGEPAKAVIKTEPTSVESASAALAAASVKAE